MIKIYTEHVLIIFTASSLEKYDKEHLIFPDGVHEEDVPHS